MLVEIYYMGFWGSFPLVTPHPHSYTTGPFSKTKQKSKTLSSGKLMYKSAFSDHTLTILLKTSENHALPLLFFNFSYLRHSEMTHFETLPVESDGSGKCWVWFIIRNGERKEEALIKVPNCTSGLDCGQGRGPDGTSGDLQTYAEAFSYYLGFLVRKPRCTWWLMPSLFSSL